MGLFSAEWILRLVCALASGIVIGYERQSRNKDAGVRTHAIVALAACLLMIISQYGFEGSDKFDAARIAAQVVSGVGFLGAGVIFVRNDTVQGLTTAAGIFLTAALGLGFGAGMYLASGITLCCLLILQIVLRHLGDKQTITVTLLVRMNEEGDTHDITRTIHRTGFHIQTSNINADGEGYTYYASCYTNTGANPYEMNRQIENLQGVTSSELI